MTELRISLSPTGGIRLHLPDQRRTLDIPIEFQEKVECECCGERFISPIVYKPLRDLKRLLVEAAGHDPNHPKKGYIGAFPTQAVLDAWLAADAKKQAADTEAKWAEKGIDVKALEFKL
jgi:hypothetical protein